MGDTAYLGTVLKTPKRKPRDGELTRREKAGNRRVSRKRIVVEHGIGKMKVWRGRPSGGGTRVGGTPW